MFDLFTTYPELQARIDLVCQGAAWALTGVAALVHDDAHYYFELTGPKHWQVRGDGTRVMRIGGIGGSLEVDEPVLGCLYREVEEELNALVDVESSTETHLVYEQQLAETLGLDQREHPLPVVFTISQNLTRRHIYPAAEILAIPAFTARLREAPSLGDLYGYLKVPFAALRPMFTPDETTLERLLTLGVEYVAREVVAPDVVLAPLLTARSIQILVQSDRI